MHVQFKPVLLITLTFLVLASSMSAAQSVTGDPADLEFEIINATTGQPGSIERLLLQYSSSSISPILDIEPRGSLFEVPAVPVLDRGKYIMTAWAQGVPYYWSLRGRDLLKSPVQLHVFDTKDGIEDVTIVGMNLLVRQTESLLQVEYLLQIDNAARPQVTLNGRPHVMLNLPRGLERATLSFGNGPDQEKVELTGLSGGMTALDIPLTTGRNKVQLVGSMAWQDGVEIPVSANVPIQDWSLMASPEHLNIQAFDLETDNSAQVSGYTRLKGPAVDADESFQFRIFDSPGAGAEEELFTQNGDELENNDDNSAKSDKEKDKGFPFVVLTPIFVVFLVIVMRKRRQS